MRNIYLHPSPFVDLQLSILDERPKFGMSVPGITLYLCISPEIEGYVRNPECRILNFRTWGYQCAPTMAR